MTGRVLIVDDDPAERCLLEEIVSSAGHSCEAAEGGEAALARLARSDLPQISAMILDLVMPDIDGMAVLERLARRQAAPPVIVQTRAEGADAAVSAIRAGACDFLVKPIVPERVRVSLATALKLSALENEISRLKRSRAGTLGFADIILRSPSTERVISVGERAARSTLPVLIEGERGVGKELVARAIHGSGPRRSKPFVAVNCAAPALPIEIELLGAHGDCTDGKLRLAQAGTLYLDEIGTLSAGAQEKLLSMLEEACSDVSHRTRRADLRLIAGTSRRLIDYVSEGLFREDLFYRLNVLPIWLPPLRERRLDVPDLARNILARLAAEEGKSIIGLAPEALKLLSEYDWPGNLKELESTIFRALLCSDGGELEPRDFPRIRACLNPAAAAEFMQQANAAQLPNSGLISVANQRHIRNDHNSLPASRADRNALSRYGVTRLLDERGDLRPFGMLEEEVIRFAVDHYRGHMSEVARRLGIGRSTLYRKLKDYGIVSGAAMTP